MRATASPNDREPRVERRRHRCRQTTTTLVLAHLTAFALPGGPAYAADVEQYKGFTYRTFNFDSQPTKKWTVSAFMNIDYTNQVVRGYSWLDLDSSLYGSLYTTLAKQSGSGTTFTTGGSFSGYGPGRITSSTNVVGCGGGALFTSYGQWFVQLGSQSTQSSQPSNGQASTCVR